MSSFQRLLYFCGQLGLMMMVRFFFQWNLKYAEQRSGDHLMLFDAAVFGLVFLLFRIFDGVTNPLAGVVGDRWVRAGRERRSLLRYAVIGPPVGLVLIFLSSHAMSPSLRWPVALAGMVIFFLGYTFYAVPYWSLIDDYSGDDAAEQRRLSSLLGVGILAATGIAGVGAPLMVEAWGFFPAAAAHAVVGGVLLILPYYAQPAARAGRRPAPSSVVTLRQMLTQALTHRRLVAVLLLFTGYQMALTVISVAAPFITERLLGGSEKDVALIMGAFLGTALPASFLTPRLSRRYGWQRPMVGAAAMLALVFTGAAFLGQAWIGTRLQTAMVFFGAAGPFAAVVLGLEGEGVTSCAREAAGEVTSLYWGALTLVVKAFNGLATFLVGLLVNLADQPGYHVDAVRGMTILAGGLIFLGVLAYAAIRPRQPAQTG